MPRDMKTAALCRIPHHKILNQDKMLHGGECELEGCCQCQPQSCSRRRQACTWKFRPNFLRRCKAGLEHPGHSQRSYDTLVALCAVNEGAQGKPFDAICVFGGTSNAFATVVAALNGMGCCKMTMCQRIVHEMVAIARCKVQGGLWSHLNANR